MPAFAAVENKSRGQKHSRFQVRGFRAGRLQPASVDQSADRGLNGELETCVQFQGLRRSEGILGILSIVRRGAAVRAKRKSVPRRDRSQPADGIFDQRPAGGDAIADFKWTL